MAAQLPCSERARPASSVDAEEDATLALVTLDGQGRASYTFYGPGTADWQWDATECLTSPPPRRPT